MKKTPPKPWRYGVGFIVTNTNRFIWIGKRSGNVTFGWQFPQGGIDDNETPEEALWRELHEELGITNGKILATHPGWLSYEIPPHTLMGQKYCGQKQKWFLIETHSTDIKLNEEFSAWQWIDSNQVNHFIAEKVVPFKRSIYQEVWAYFYSYFK